MSNAQACIVWVTAPNETVAKKLARTCVTQRLAACVNIVPSITSVYSWQGSLHEESEVLMLIKTLRDQVDVLKRCLLETHPYDTPEFLVTSCDEMDERYGAWLGAAVGGAPV